MICNDSPPVDLLDVFEDDLNGLFCNRVCSVCIVAA